MQVIVVGGGAAGLMAAVTAAENGHKVTVVERNPRPARKVMITGKGRCNVTNNCSVSEFISHVPQNGRFLYSALSRFESADLMAWLEERGLPLKTERGNRVFPVSDKAVDVVDCLVKAARRAGVTFLQGRVTSLVLEEGVCTGVMLEDGRQLEAYAVVICTGGLSYPGTGSTGDGYTLAQQAGHTIVPTRPSLVPLETQEYWSGKLQGLSLKNVTCTVTDTANGKVIFSELGELLFTHYGLSGPLILSASAHMREMAPCRYTVKIDLKPGLTPEKLDARLTRDLGENPNLDFANALGALLPHKLIPEAVALSGIPPHTKCHSVTREQRQRFGQLLKALPLTVMDFRPVEEAVVTSGGVDVREVDARTMASKKAEGLYFAGEVLDVDAYTGGFNLQIAFSTGHAAGESL